MFSWHKVEKTGEERPLLADIETGAPGYKSKLNVVLVQSTHFLSFPSDIIRIILSNLSVHDLNAIAATCKRLLQLSQTVHLDENHQLTYKMLRNAMRDATQNMKQFDQTNNQLIDLQNDINSLEAKKYYCRFPARISCGMGTLLAAPGIIGLLAGIIYGKIRFKNDDAIVDTVILAVICMCLGIVLSFGLLAIASCAESISHNIEQADHKLITNKKAEITALQRQLVEEGLSKESLQRDANMIKSKVKLLEQHWMTFSRSQPAPDRQTNLEDRQPGLRKLNIP